MPNHSAISAQQIETSLHQPSSSAFKRFAVAVKSKANLRRAKIAGVAFAATLPALGVVDPAVLVESGLTDVATVTGIASRIQAAMSNMAVLELGATVAFILTALIGVGYLRTRTKDTAE